MSNFITPAELKAYPLPVTSAQWSKVGDDQLAIVIGYASDHLEDWMDRRILTGNYVERHRGTGLQRQMMSQYPIVTLNAVTAYNNANVGTSYTVNKFWTDNSAGILEWLDKNTYAFTRGVSWEFDYDAGFSSVPGPIKHATALQTVKMLQPLFRGGSNFTEVELITELDEQILELLDNYKRRRTG